MFFHDLRSMILLCGFAIGEGFGEKGLNPRFPGECITVDFPFCGSCSPHYLPIPSAPQLDLSSLCLSSPGSSTVVKHDECCKINSVWLNIYKLSFFTDIAKGISFKSLVPKWGSWASKKKSYLILILRNTWIFFFHSAASGRYPSEEKLTTNPLLDHITEKDIL